MKAKDNTEDTSGLEVTLSVKKEEGASLENTVEKLLGDLSLSSSQIGTNVVVQKEPEITNLKIEENNVEELEKIVTIKSEVEENKEDNDKITEIKTTNTEVEEKIVDTTSLQQNPVENNSLLPQQELTLAENNGSALLGNKVADLGLLE